MQEQIKQIAERIRELREIGGVAQEALAKELNVPTDLFRDSTPMRISPGTSR